MTRFFAVRRWAALIVAAVAVIAGAVAPGSALAVPGAAPAAAGPGALTDLFVYNSSSGASAVELANGSGGWNDVPGPQFSAGWQVYPGNYNGDGQTDLFVYNPSTGASYVDLANGPRVDRRKGPQFSARWSVYPGSYGGSYTDLFVYNPSTDASYVELANGSGGWTGVKGPQFSAGWQVYPGSYGGSYTGLFLYNPSTGASYVDLANGSGGWTGLKGPQFSAGWSVYPGSYGGSYTDLFVYNPSTGASYVELANGSGGWTGVKGPQFFARLERLPGQLRRQLHRLVRVQPVYRRLLRRARQRLRRLDRRRRNPVSAGWSVYPGNYGGSNTDLFVYNPSTGASYVELANGSGGWTGVKEPRSPPAGASTPVTTGWRRRRRGSRRCRCPRLRPASSAARPRGTSTGTGHPISGPLSAASTASTRIRPPAGRPPPMWPCSSSSGATAHACRTRAAPAGCPTTPVPVRGPAHRSPGAQGCCRRSPLTGTRHSRARTCSSSH